MLPDTSVAEGRMTWEQCRDLIVIEIDDLVLDVPLSLRVKKVFFELLEVAERIPSVKGVLLMNLPGTWSGQAYQRFIERLAGAIVATTDDREAVVDRALVLSREETAAHQFLQAINSFKKVFMIGIQGSVAPPFFGSSLACDFRLVASDFQVDFSHLDLGIPPCGGFGFYLPRYLGQGRAVEMLLSKEPLTAGRALDLGLVTRIVDGADFRTACIEQARQLVRIPAGGIQATRELLQPSAEELDTYLTREFEALERAIHAG